MGNSNFRVERNLLKRRIWPVAGIDEAGRGPLARPVAAAAVILNPRKLPRGVNDSKRLTPEERERLAELLCCAASRIMANRNCSFQPHRVGGAPIPFQPRIE